MLKQRSDSNIIPHFFLVRKAIEFEYTNWLNPGDPIRNREQVDRFTGDWQFTCPVVEFAHR